MCYCPRDYCLRTLLPKNVKKTCDPPFPIYVLFLLFNFMSKCNEKEARQGGDFHKTDDLSFPVYAYFVFNFHF